MHQRGMREGQGPSPAPVRKVKVEFRKEKVKNRKVFAQKVKVKSSNWKVTIPIRKVYPNHWKPHLKKVIKKLLGRNTRETKSKERFPERVYLWKS